VRNSHKRKKKGRKQGRKQGRKKGRKQKRDIQKIWWNELCFWRRKSVI